MKKNAFLFFVFCCFAVVKTEAQTIPNNNYIKISGRIEPIDTNFFKACLFIKIVDKKYYTNYNYSLYNKTIINILEKVVVSNYYNDNNLSFVLRRNEDIMVIID